MLKFLPTALVLVLVLVAMLFLPAPTPKKVQTAAKPVDTTTSDYSVQDVLTASGDFDPNASQAIYDNQPVEYPQKDLSDAFDAPQNSAVLGTTNAAGEEKWIEVDLEKQQVTAWEGNTVVKQFLISSGKYFPTPKGTFYIWYKTRSQRMVGGSKELGTYYNLPNVPNNMFFYQGYALHGAYWHHNWGHPMSHGCVNEPLDEAAWMFDWAGPVVPAGVNAVKATPENPGTRVWIH